MATDADAVVMVTVNGKKPLHAQQFSRQMGNGKGKWFFGLNQCNMAASLRQLADAIEKEEILSQRVEVKTVACADDYLETHLTFVLVESGEVLL